MKRILSLLLILLLSSCSHEPKKKFEQAIHAGRCEEAYAKIPENDKNVKLVSEAERAAGTAFSYAVTGGGYVVDIVLYTGSTVLIGMVTCLPAAAVTAVAGGHGGTAIPCGTPMPAKLPGYGKGAYKDTAKLRCPDLTGLSRSLRQVAECHESKGTIEGRRDALQTLQSIKSDDTFLKCVSADEVAALEAQRTRLQNSL